MMTNASEYRQYARECMESAAKASTDVERRTFLDMARTWENAALAIEAQERPAVAAPLDVGQAGA
jgi:hypothetical protein